MTPSKGEIFVFYLFFLQQTSILKIGLDQFGSGKVPEKTAKLVIRKNQHIFCSILIKSARIHLDLFCIEYAVHILLSFTCFFFTNIAAIGTGLQLL